MAIAQARFDEAVNSAAQALKESQRRSRDPSASADVGEASLFLAKALRALNDGRGSREAAHQAVISLTASLGADNALTRDALALQ